MRLEEAGEEGARPRHGAGGALDEEVRGGAVGVGDLARVELQAAERERHRLRVVEDRGGARVGEELAPPAQRQLQHHGGDRRQHEGDDRRDQLQRIAVAAAAAAEEGHPEREVADDRDHADEHRGERHQPHVLVADVGDLVGEHGLELPRRHQLAQAARDADVDRRGPGAGGERVRSRVVDEVDRRRRGQAGRDRDVLDQPIELRIVALLQRRRMREPADQAAGVPPREHAVGEAEREQADRAAAPDECGRGRGEDDDERGKGEDDVRRAPSVGPDLLLERHRAGYDWKLTATGARSS